MPQSDLDLGLMQVLVSELLAVDVTEVVDRDARNADVITRLMPVSPELLVLRRSRDGRFDPRPQLNLDFGGARTCCGLGARYYSNGEPLHDAAA